MGFFDKVLPKIAAIAPSIATSLGGPLAGWGVTEIAKVFGITPDAPDSEKQITQALETMTPDQAIKLKEADLTFAEHMRQMDIDLEEISRKDRDSARNMQVQTRDYTPRVLAVGVTFGFFALLAIMAFYTVPVPNQAPLNIMIGALGSAFGGIVGFYFGSSSGSQAKDATIRDMAAK